MRFFSKKKFNHFSTKNSDSIDFKGVEINLIHISYKRFKWIVQRWCNGDDRIFHYKWSFTCTVKTFLLLLRTSIRDSKSRCQGDSTRHWEQWFSIARKFFKKNINEMLIKENFRNTSQSSWEKKESRIFYKKKERILFLEWNYFHEKIDISSSLKQTGDRIEFTIINRLVFIIRV